MFEKEAEEFTTENGYGSDCNNITSYEANECIFEAFQDGAEFGYNKALEQCAEKFAESNRKWQEVLDKANEWHYVKDGDLPNIETKNYTYIRRRKRYERQFTDYRVIKCFVLCQNEKGKITAEVGYFDCNQKCFLNNAEGIVIAWKEIVLPKDSENAKKRKL